MEVGQNVGHGKWMERVSQLASSSQQSHSPPESNMRSRSFSPRPTRVSAESEEKPTYDPNSTSRSSRTEVMSKLREEASYQPRTLELPRQIAVRSIIPKEQLAATSTGTKSWNTPPSSPPKQDDIKYWPKGAFVEVYHEDRWTNAVVIEDGPPGTLVRWIDGSAQRVPSRSHTRYSSRSTPFPPVPESQLSESSFMTATTAPIHRQEIGELSKQNAGTMVKDQVAALALLNEEKKQAAEAARLAKKEEERNRVEMSKNIGSDKVNDYWEKRRPRGQSPFAPRESSRNRGRVSRGESPFRDQINRDLNGGGSSVDYSQSLRLDGSSSNSPAYASWRGRYLSPSPSISNEMNGGRATRPSSAPRAGGSGGSLLDGSSQQKEEKISPTARLLLSRSSKLLAQGELRRSSSPARRSSSPAPRRSSSPAPIYRSASPPSYMSMTMPASSSGGSGPQSWTSPPPRRNTAPSPEPLPYGVAEKPTFISHFASLRSSLPKPDKEESPVAESIMASVQNHMISGQRDNWLKQHHDNLNDHLAKQEEQMRPSSPSPAKRPPSPYAQKATSSPPVQHRSSAAMSEALASLERVREAFAPTKKPIQTAATRHPTPPSRPEPTSLLLPSSNEMSMPSRNAPPSLTIQPPREPTSPSAWSGSPNMTPDGERTMRAVVMSRVGSPTSSQSPKQGGDEAQSKRVAHPDGNYYIDDELEDKNGSSYNHPTLYEDTPQAAPAVEKSSMLAAPPKPEDAALCNDELEDKSGASSPQKQSQVLVQDTQEIMQATPKTVIEADDELEDKNSAPSPQKQSQVLVQDTQEIMQATPKEEDEGEDELEDKNGAPQIGMFGKKAIIMNEASNIEIDSPHSANKEDGSVESTPLVESVSKFSDEVSATIGVRNDVQRANTPPCDAEESGEVDIDQPSSPFVDPVILQPKTTESGIVQEAESRSPPVSPMQQEMDNMAVSLSKDAMSRVDKVSDEVLELQLALKRSEEARQADRQALMELRAKMEALTSMIHVSTNQNTSNQSPPLPTPKPQEQSPPPPPPTQVNEKSSPPIFVSSRPVLRSAQNQLIPPPPPPPQMKQPSTIGNTQSTSKAQSTLPKRPSAVQHFANFRTNNRGQNFSLKPNDWQKKAVPLENNDDCSSDKGGDYASSDKGGDYASSDKGGDYASSDKGGDYASSDKGGDYASSDKGGDYASSDKGGDFYSDKGGDDWEDYGKMIETDDEYLASAEAAQHYSQSTRSGFSGNAKMRGATPWP